MRLRKYIIYDEKKEIDVDMVITYVDGNDNLYQNKKREYIEKNNLNVDYHPEIRSVNINEIKYCVKSVIKYLPWVRNIFIVTDNQIPPICRFCMKKGRVKIIDHKEIIEEKYLPTFNSDVIESYLHNIPGLSEIFMYNNDDIFHLEKVNRNDIYVELEGDIKLKIKSRFNLMQHKRYDGEYSKRLVLTADYLKKKFPEIKLINNHHTKILRKSTLKLIENKFVDKLHQLRINHIRSNNYIQYLFFAINIDNVLHDNIISTDFSDVIEYHTNNREYKDGVFNKLKKNVKFICINSMNDSYRNPFIDFMADKLGRCKL